MSPGWCEDRLGAHPGQRRGQAVDGLAAVPGRASSQSASALMLLTTSPMPARLCRSGPASTKSRSTMHRDRDVHPVGALDPAGDQRRHRGGDAVVGQARRHRHHRQAAPGGRVLGHVDRLAAADADHRVVRPGAQLSAQVVGGLRGVPPATVNTSAERSDGRISSAICSPCPGPTTTATSPAGGDPPVGQDRRRGRPPRPAARRCAAG